MFLPSIIALFAIAIPPQQSAPLSLSNSELIDTAHKLALDEGWPIDQKGYTFDTMQSVGDDGFYSIGLYRNAHLMRMYSIQKQTGDIVDFMHGCDLIQFDNIKDLQTRIRKASNAAPLPIDRLAAQVGCPKLTIVNTRWVH